LLGFRAASLNVLLSMPAQALLCHWKNIVFGGWREAMNSCMGVNAVWGTGYCNKNISRYFSYHPIAVFCAKWICQKYQDPLLSSSSLDYNGLSGWPKFSKGRC
jgi:hypothetical protein